MSTDWLSRDLWRAHVSWLTPPWIGSTPEGRKDFDANRWLDQIQSAHYQTLIFYVKFLDGFMAYPSKYSTIQPERDFFGECIREVRKRGMRIVAYFPSTWDQVSGKTHPDWRALDREGKFINARGWETWAGAFCCINNPGYRDMVLGQLAELRDNYGPDGFWIDMFWPVAEENCFCPHCRKKYEMETKGNLLDTRGQEWYDSCFVELMKEIRDLVKKNNPDVVVGQNTGTRIPGVEHYVDFLTHEALAAPTMSLMCRSLRSLGKPYENTYRLYSSVGSWAMKAPNRVLLEATTTVAHGGASCLELPPTAMGRIMDEPVRRAQEVGKYIRDRESYLVNTEPVYDAAMFQPETRFDGWFLEGGWNSVLIERDIPFAILYPDGEFSPYRLVILDDRITPDTNLARRLKDYVASGGNLIVEAGAVSPGTPAGDILSEVLGINVLGKTGYPAHYLTKLDGQLTDDMGEDDLVVEGEGYKAQVTSARPMGFIKYEFATRAPDRSLMAINFPPKAEGSNDPAITLNHFGQGRAMFLACPLGRGEIRKHRYTWDEAREYPIQLGSNLARFMIGQPLLEGTTPAGVEVVVNSQGNRHIVHLLNNYVAGQYYDNRRGILKLADVPVVINEGRIGPVKRVARVVDGKEKELPIHRESGWISIRISELLVHELIILDH
jgi:alpha-L-fucosidase